MINAAFCGIIFVMSRVLAGSKVCWQLIANTYSPSILTLLTLYYIPHHSQIFLSPTFVHQSEINSNSDLKRTSPLPAGCHYQRQPLFSADSEHRMSKPAATHTPRTIFVWIRSVLEIVQWTCVFVSRFGQQRDSRETSSDQGTTEYHCLLRLVFFCDVMSLDGMTKQRLIIDLFSWSALSVASMNCHVVEIFLSAYICGKYMYWYIVQSE